MATPYPEVTEALGLLLTGVQAILGDQLVGLYLYGSLASGDFDPQRSDVDFVVVTENQLSETIISSLKAMHLRLHSGGAKMAAKLEGAYISRNDIRRFQANAAPCPYVNEGNFRVGVFGSDWMIQRHVLREQGVAVAGPDPKSLIDPVSADDLRRAVRDTLREWWQPMLDHPDPRLGGGEYQAYAVLSMCRALYTLKNGAIASKKVSARWAEETLDERWKPLIRRAAAWRPGDSLDAMDEALEFIRYTTSTRPLRQR